ncbi:MAG: XisH family protein [Anaerolineae bacterium]|nr:XisH family protein [Anaerolineae bacterium]
MPAKDFLHDIVKTALIRDGWVITDDPYTVAFGARRVYVDLGAERLLAAEKGQQKIAVEVKSFVGLSHIYELEKAIGQYAVYKSWLARTEPERILYIALDVEIFDELFQDISGQVLLEDYAIKLIVVDAELLEVSKWIN